MKTVFAFLVLALALLIISGIAHASATNWQIYIQVSDLPDTDHGTGRLVLVAILVLTLTAGLICLGGLIRRRRRRV